MGRANAKRGPRADLGGLVLKSSWEANVCRYFNFLKAHGQIKDWEYEPEKFTFSSVKTGRNMSYTPDFGVLELDGRMVFYEVKGWLDPDSKVKLKRMAKEYPEIEIVLIDKDAYKEIERKLGGLIQGWE